MNLRARVYLAETLQKRDRDGDVEEAKRLLKEVLDAPVGRYGVRPRSFEQRTLRAPPSPFPVGNPLTVRWPRGALRGHT